MARCGGGRSDRVRSDVAGVTGGDEGTGLSRPCPHALSDLLGRGRGAEMRPRAALGSGTWGSAPASQVPQDKHLMTSGSRKHGRERLPGPGVAPHCPAPKIQRPHSAPRPSTKASSPSPEAAQGPARGSTQRAEPWRCWMGLHCPAPGTTVGGTGPWGPELGSVLAGGNQQQTDAGSTGESWRQGWCPHELTTQQTRVR